MQIYKTTNLLNGMIYVGQDSKSRPNYLGSGKILENAIKKHGRENFTKEILEDNIETQEVLDKKEKYWIQTLNSRDRKIGYNIAHGGQAGTGWFTGCKHSDETKKMWASKNFQQGEKNAFYGKKHSEYSKSIISEKAKIHALGERNGMFGKQHHDNSKSIMSQKKQGIYNGGSNPRALKMSKYTQEMIFIETYNCCKECCESIKQNCTVFYRNKVTKIAKHNSNCRINNTQENYQKIDGFYVFIEPKTK